MKKKGHTIGPGADLAGADLSRCKMRDVDLEGANLEGADLSMAHFWHVNMRGANLQGANLGKAKFHRAVDFRGANLQGASLKDARGTGLKSTNLSDADLSGADLTGVRLLLSPANRTVFRNARLDRVSMWHTDFSGCDFRGASLRGARLGYTGGTDFSDADFAGADLREATFSIPCLVGADLTKADLREASMRGGDFEGAKLVEANLENADFCSSRLVRVDVRRARLVGLILDDSEIEDVDFSDTTLKGIGLGLATLRNVVWPQDLSAADFGGCDLSGIDWSNWCLREAVLEEANLREAKLSGADLTGADLALAHLEGAKLSGADLTGADLVGAHLEGAKLSGADLTGADLEDADLSGADLSGADLSGANLSGANLDGVNLARADLRKAKLDRVDLSQTDLTRVDLTDAKVDEVLDWPNDYNPSPGVSQPEEIEQTTRSKGFSSGSAVKATKTPKAKPRKADSIAKPAPKPAARPKTQRAKTAPPTKSATKGKAMPTTSSSQRRDCPNCGGPMVERINSRDGSQFLSCEDYPDCRGTRNLGGERRRRGSTPDWVGRTTTEPVAPCTSSLPAALSPTNATDFMRCPRVFYEKVISKRVEFVGTPASTKGKLAHTAFERIFSLSPAARTERAAVGLVRAAWKEIRGDAESVKVAALPNREIEAMLKDAEAAVRNWYGLSDPTSFTPKERELTVEATLNRAPMRGIIDRVDDLGGGRVAIVDYKTGKQPRREFKEEALLPIRIYAAAMSTKSGVTVSEVRLLYVSPAHQGMIQESVTRSSVGETKRQFASIWDDIKVAAREGRFESRTSPLCDYCDAQPICPAWT